MVSCDQGRKSCLNYDLCFPLQSVGPEGRSHA